ncbi:MAG: hypothetical protein ACLFQJ_05605 [Campylobacterales bacterium]
MATRTVTIGVRDIDYPYIKEFLKSFGGPTAFFRKALKEHGYKEQGLKDIAKRVKEADREVVKDFDGVIGDGIA